MSLDKSTKEEENENSKSKINKNGYEEMDFKETYRETSCHKETIDDDDESIESVTPTPIAILTIVRESDSDNCTTEPTEDTDYSKQQIDSTNRFTIIICWLIVCMISFIILGTLRKDRNYLCLKILSIKNSFKWVQEISVKWGRTLLKRVKFSISNESKKNKAKKMEKGKISHNAQQKKTRLALKTQLFVIGMIISLGVYNTEYSVRSNTQNISVVKTKQIKFFGDHILSSQQCSVQRSNMSDNVKMAFGHDNKDVLTNY